MKTSKTKLIHKSLFTGALLVFALAQTPDAQANCVGYVNFTFHPGANLFGNPLDTRSDTPPPPRFNDLVTLIPTAPEGATVSLWDATAQGFLITSHFMGGAWTMNLGLEPGTGAQLITPSSFINTFVGEVVNGCEPRLPPAFWGPDGIYLFSRSQALTSPMINAFDQVIGRAPRTNESVTRLDAATQTYFTTTFDGLNWNNGAPALGLGEAAFYNIGPVPVPEPSTLALGLCGAVLALLAARRRRAKSVTVARR